VRHVPACCPPPSALTNCPLLQAAFRAAIDRFEYQGAYNGCFPVKANHDKALIEAVVKHGELMRRLRRTERGSLEVCPVQGLRRLQQQLEVVGQGSSSSWRWEGKAAAAAGGAGRGSSSTPSTVACHMWP
jgi:hypothetical protein